MVVIFRSGDDGESGWADPSIHHYVKRPVTPSVNLNGISITSNGLLLNFNSTTYDDVTHNVTSVPPGATGFVKGKGNQMNVTGLSPGISYSLNIVTSSNRSFKIGDKEYKNNSSAISSNVTYVTPPVAATGISASITGTTTATVSYSTTNGSATTHTLTTTPATSSYTGTSPINITGLANGTSYTFTVTESTTSGTMAATSSSFVTKPATPTISSVSITSANNATVNFTSTNGAATTYSITSTPASQTLSASGTSGTVYFTSLTGGTSYTFTITATTTSGTATVTTTSSYLTYPTAVTSISASNLGQTTATVSFSTTNPAGTTYSVTTSPSTTTTNGTSPINISGLTAGTSYTFTVAATNTSGTTSATSGSYTTTAGASTNPIYYSFNSNTVNGTSLGNMNSGSVVYEGATLANTSLISSSYKFGDRSFYTVYNSSTNRSPCITNVKFKVSNTNGFSISLWLNTTGMFRQTPFFFTNSAGDQIGMADNGGGILLGIYIYNRATSTMCYAPTGVRNTGGWAHFVLAISSTGTYYTYYNNTLKSTQTGQVVPSSADYSGNIGDGVNFPGYVPGYSGYIDEFRIFNYCLTSQQVSNLYTNNTV